MTARTAHPLLAVLSLFAVFNGMFVSAASSQVVRLTSRPGNETEAAWSPDGTRIAFQYEENGQHQLFILDLRTHAETMVRTGSGQSLYPAWTPDSGQLVYTHGRPTATAAQAADRELEEGFGLWRIDTAGGDPVQLTSGRCRDYTPDVASDGRTIWFTSTRGLEFNSTALWRLETIPGEGSVAVHVLGADKRNAGIVQPSLSPDGRHVVFGRYAGIRDNWQLWLLHADDSAKVTPLTPESLVAYAPRWSPDGTRIACTAYGSGDPGWQVYLVEPRTGRVARLDTGPGNSRSPAWSPDGQELVFENNREGHYDLYRMTVGEVTFEVADAEADQPRQPILRFGFDQAVDTTVRDRSANENHAIVHGSVSVRDGHLLLGKGNLQVQQPNGTDFGKGAFYVTADVRVDDHTDELRLLVVGDYPRHRLGWQIFFNQENWVYFNARSPSGAFIGVTPGTPFPTGRTVTVTGMRSAQGTLHLYLDGELVGRSAGAGMDYRAADQIRIGCQFNGSAPCPAALSSIEVGRGTPPIHRTRQQQLREFFEP